MNKRRSFTPEFKAKVVLEVLSGAKSPAEACREYEIKSDLLSQRVALQLFFFRAGKPSRKSLFF